MRIFELLRGVTLKEVQAKPGRALREDPHVMGSAQSFKSLGGFQSPPQHQSPDQTPPAQPVAQQPPDQAPDQSAMIPAQAQPVPGQLGAVQTPDGMGMQNGPQDQQAGQPAPMVGPKPMNGLSPTAPQASPSNVL